MKNKKICSLIIIFLVVFIGYTGDSPWEPSEKPLPSYTDKIKKAKTVDDLTAILNEAFQELYSAADDAVPDLYSKAHSCIAVAKPIITKNPKKPKKQNPIQEITSVGLNPFFFPPFFFKPNATYIKANIPLNPIII